MAKRSSRRHRSEVTFEQACMVLEGILGDQTRRQVVEEALAGGSFEGALARLRAAMRSHALQTGSGRLDLSKFVKRFDRLTRTEGFHVLQAWDFGSHKFSEDNIPVLMLDYFARERSGEHQARESLAILLDYYLLHVLSLVVMRAWDGGDANQRFDRVGELLALLDGPMGSGRPLMADAHTLLFMAVSHFHPDEHAYDRLLVKVRALEDRHQERFAHVVAAILGCHLRWGFEVLYHRDVVEMRKDNVGDYPWLLFSLAALMRRYVQLGRSSGDEVARERVVEALLNGLTADPWAFLDSVPAALAPYEAEHAELRELLHRHRHDLLEDFALHRPSPRAYSPISLHFNFPHNVLVAMATIALLEQDVPRLPLNALLRREPADGSAKQSQGELARRLMAFCEASPQRLGEHGSLLIVYEPHAALNSYTLTLDRLREL